MNGFCGTQKTLNLLGAASVTDYSDPNIEKLKHVTLKPKPPKP